MCEPADMDELMAFYRRAVERFRPYVAGDNEEESDG